MRSFDTFVEFVQSICSRDSFSRFVRSTRSHDSFIRLVRSIVRSIQALPIISYLYWKCSRTSPSSLNLHDGFSASLRKSRRNWRASDASWRERNFWVGNFTSARQTGWPFVRYDAASIYNGVANRRGSRTVNRKNKRRLTLAARETLVGLDEIACVRNRRKRVTSETELRYFIFSSEKLESIGELRETLRR